MKSDICVGTIDLNKIPKGKIFDEDFEDYIGGLRSFARGVFLLLNSNPGENCLGNDSWCRSVAVTFSTLVPHMLTVQ